MKRAARKTLKRILIDYVAPLVLPEHATVERRGIRFRLHLRDDIQFGIFCGYYERYAIPLLQSLLRPGAVCADVGANVGYWTLAMSKLVGDRGKVYAFEPDPTVRKRLRSNIALNAFAQNVSVMPCALSNASGPVMFHRAKVDHHSGWGSIEHYEDIAESQIPVQSVTLDQFLRERRLDHLDLIKIDVEGHEPRVISGMRETLQSHSVDAMIIEINAPRLAQIGSDFNGVISELKDLGYEPSYDFNGNLLRDCLSDVNHRLRVCSNFLFSHIKA